MDKRPKSIFQFFVLLCSDLLRGVFAGRGKTVTAGWSNSNLIAIEQCKRSE